MAVYWRLKPCARLALPGVIWIELSVAADTVIGVDPESPLVGSVALMVAEP